MSMEHGRLLRSLLLPINLKQEPECIKTISQSLEEIVGHDFEEQSSWLNHAISDWDDNGKPENQFKALIIKILKIGNPEYSDVISEKYFEAQEELIQNQLMKPVSARSFLSHLLLMVRLADEEKMSCAQIAKILGVMNPSAGFDRRPVSAIMGKLGLAPSMTIEKITDLLASDRVALIGLFGDASFDECVVKVENIAFKLGFKGEIANYLSILFDQHQVEKYSPYIQILHNQCSIIEYYDHHIKDLYEFSPRGVATTKLLESYPSSMAKGANPFLNNAKSVQQVTFAWAASKKNKEFAGASSLFYILDAMDEMGFAARQEFALWLRCFIHRFMLYAEPLDTPIISPITSTQLQAFLAKVAEKNTATRGIIEQRFVDAVATVFHPETEGWVSRGIGDAVNASNLSKKKLGDCDFQHINESKAIAYEAHGGVLTQQYLGEHLKTLEKLAKPRIDEWGTYSNSSNWKVEIIFVAHSVTAVKPDPIEINGVIFTIGFVTYAQLITMVDKDHLASVFDSLVIAPLAEKRTPSFVRNKFNNLIKQ